MRQKVIIALVLLVALCAISLESASAQNAPPLQGLVWLQRASYNVGETVPIQYLVTRTASVTITISGPSGTQNFNMGSVRGSAVLTFNGRAGQPGGWRTVTMRATASSNPRDVITARTTFNVGSSWNTPTSPPPTFSAPA
jgi:hypothetical protein